MLEGVIEGVWIDDDEREGLLELHSVRVFKWIKLSCFTMGVVWAFAAGCRVDYITFEP